MNSNEKELDGYFIKMANENAEQKKAELEEIYAELRAKNAEKRKIAKKELKAKKKRRQRIIIAILILCGVAGIGATKYISDKKIYKRVEQSGVIPKDLSIRNDSMSGLLISYEDEYNNRQNMGSEYFTYITTEKGKKEGFNIDEIAIALDYRGIPANTVEGSTFVGRMREEAEELLPKKDNTEEITEGRTK